MRFRLAEEKENFNLGVDNCLSIENEVGKSHCRDWFKERVHTHLARTDFKEVYRMHSLKTSWSLGHSRP